MLASNITSYIKMRKTKTMEEIQKDQCISEADVYILEIGYQYYLKKISLNKALKIASIHNEVVRTIARNCVAWDTSKDKTEGLLPEVCLTNEWLYKQFTGEEYNFSKACKKFNIGD